MTHRAYPLGKVYTLLEPGPVVLLGTARDGRPNLMAMSWHTMLEFEPPQLGCVVSDRNHSYASLVGSGLCTINIPTAELAEQVVGVGNCSGADTDKFARFGLSAVPARAVDAPRVRECYAQLECRVIDDSMVARYGLFVLEVVRAWVDRGIAEPRTIHHEGWGRFGVLGDRIRLKSGKK